MDGNEDDTGNLYRFLTILKVTNNSLATSTPYLVALNPKIISGSTVFASISKKVSEKHCKFGK